ncbi:cytochrome P450 [Streptosporangium album]|uniref:Cytochrome P450 n=1 Tax=Streptosporangium album TaxID=47479 RepID=A0A7W7RT76_9ACTN|nr:cytochrome P450 [Streptosporangium album]MBB4937749.1 cytochrome P450 [Streptosporangium album]
MTNAHHSPDPSSWFPSPPAPAGYPAHPGAIPLYGPRFHQDPARLYREMRQQHGQVVPVLLEGDVPAWLVIGYRELRHVLSNPQLFARDSRRWNAWDRIPPDWPLMAYVGYQPSMLFTEGAEHQRRAGAVSAALAAVDQFELKTQCEQIADSLIDAFTGSGRADLMAHYAHPMPLLVIAAMFGLPNSEAPGLVVDVSATLNGGESAMEAYQRVHATMQRLLDSKRERPGPDVPSRLLAHPAGPADEEIIQDLIVVMTAGQDTTANWIGNTLRLMLTDERFAVTLSGGRRSAGQALNEVLWEDSPSQSSIGRWATQDTQLGGQRIRAGDGLIIGMAAANADPQVRPDSYGGSAGNHAHMSFGHGEHGCPHPAPEIAEVIAHTAVEVILDRLPDVMLAVPADTLVWRTSIQMRGLSALPVEFTPGYVTGRG